MGKPLRTKTRNWIQPVVLVVILFFCFRVSVTGEQTQKVNLNKLTNELQKTTEDPDEMTLVWWIPEEFWMITFEQDLTVTQAEAEEIISVFRHYTVLAIVDGKIGTFGGVTYKSEEDIRSNIHIADSKGNLYSPLRYDRIDSDTRSILSVMKPILANILGPIGENMHFYLFPAKDKSDNKIADVKKEGSFFVKLGEREFRWRLPLGSLLPPKICPACGEELNGAYKYCPWDGTRLE